MKENKVLFTKLKENAIIPTRESSNAGWDIYICPNSDEDVWNIEPHETKLIPTGIASIIPEGYYMQVQERSSTGSKGIKYSAGVIDSNYRGEWKLAIYNSTNKPIIIVLLVPIFLINKEINIDIKPKHNNGIVVSIPN